MTETYVLGAGWLLPCDQIEDWGCGKGFLRTVVPADKYRGIDGSASRFCDEVVDLVNYQSTVAGVFMRHVLEHNPNWHAVLDNACASFTQRMALILFTPMTDGPTFQRAWCEAIGVPDISFNHDEIMARIPEGVTVTFTDMPSSTFYRTERIYYLERQ